jgi:hypothetical protein
VSFRRSNLTRALVPFWAVCTSGERCRAAHTTCGEERPCRRCTRKGFTDCQDATVECVCFCFVFFGCSFGILFGRARDQYSKANIIPHCLTITRKKPPRRRLSSEPKRKTQFLEFIPGAPKKRFKSQESKDGAEAHQLFHFTIDPLPESPDEPVMPAQVPAPTKSSKVDMRGRSVSSPAESPRTLYAREAAFLGYGYARPAFLPRISPQSPKC